MTKNSPSHRFGIVILKDWIQSPESSHNVHQVAGPIELVTAKEDFGFQPKGNETNWAVKVGTEDRKLIILGCQIRAIYYGKPPEWIDVNLNIWLIK